MTAITFDEWCAENGDGIDHSTREQRYRAYVAGVNFIRSQIGGMPSIVERIAGPAFTQASYDRTYAGA